ncbi:GNAT family N-acetyltransferase [Psychrobacter sp.]|uniref:GNAT family N-acetyltransferase n=1 Tax=Psychrobacter sp. TaxID=56811 RepID=UPI003561F677
MFFIRKADQHDVSDIAHIHFTSWHATYADLLPKAYRDKENNLPQKIAMWGKIMLSSGVNTWIAYDDENNNVGFISYFTKNNECEITTLYILPQYQSLGLGTKLMNAAIEDISRHNRCITLSLWVLENNLPAISFYKKSGFEPDGKHSEELYEDSKIIDIRMVKSL